jgi:hypothetical protein
LESRQAHLAKRLLDSKETMKRSMLNLMSWIQKNVPLVLILPLLPKVTKNRLTAEPESLVLVSYF